MGGALTALGLGLVLVVMAGGFGSPSLLVVGAGLLFLGGGSLAWVSLARPRRLVREPGPQRVVEGEAFALRIRAIGMRVPPPGGELRDSLLDSPLAVGPRWRGELRREVELHGRGRRRLGPARLELRDPLGLCRRSIVSAAPGELLVLPRVEPVLAAGPGSGGRRAARVSGGVDESAGPAGHDARAIELEVDGLRAYRQGSPASRIHWPAVARTGELVERRLVAGGDSAPLVVLDASVPVDAEALDAAVRAAASLCVALARSGGCAALLGGDRRVTELDSDLRAWPQLHARLALIEAGSPAPAVARALRPGAVFWVTAAARPALPPGLRSPAGGRRYLVAPGSPGQSAGGVAFTVAGCEGRQAGSRGRAAGRRAA